MAIKPPAWCRGAVPTLRGWENPSTGELLVSGKHSQDQIDEYMGLPVISAPEPEIEEPEIEAEEEYEYYDLSSMTKAELVELAEEYEIDTDGMIKSEIVAALEEVMEE
jgi:hypothetical protein